MAGSLESLRQMELFLGLTDEDLFMIEPFCREANYQAGDVILRIGDPVDDLYLIRRGSVEVLTRSSDESAVTNAPDIVVVVLGKGQTFGEMGLVDRGARSATVRAQSALDVYVIDCVKFLDLCDQYPHLGFQVMRNIATDLSFKLRHSNLI